MNQKQYLKLHEELCATAALLDVNEIHQPLSTIFADLCEDVCVPRRRILAQHSAMWLIRKASQLAGRNTSEAVEGFGATGRELSLRKNKDYADPDRATDPKFAIFKNFMKCEQLGICSVEAGFLVRLSDKVARCETLMARDEGPAVVDEKLDDTLLDVVNYTCLLIAYLKTKSE